MPSPFTSEDPFQRLTAGGTYRRAIAILNHRPDVFLTIGGIIFLPLMAFMITYFHFVGTSMHTMDAMVNGNGDSVQTYDSVDAMMEAQQAQQEVMMQNMVKFMGQFVVEYIVFIGIAIAGQAGMAHAVAEIYADRHPPTWKEALKKGCSRWCDIFGAALLVGFAMPLGNIVIQLIVIGLGSTQRGFLVVLGFIVAVGWVVVLTYVMVSLMILAQVIMIEGKGPIKAIKRCWEISSNNRCYIFCTGFVGLAMSHYMVQMIIYGILAAIGGIDAVYSTWGAIAITLPALAYVPLVSM